MSMAPVVRFEYVRTLFDSSQSQEFIYYISTKAHFKAQFVSLVVLGPISPTLDNNC